MELSSSTVSSNEDIPALLLSHCWSLISAERNRVVARPVTKSAIDVFTASFLRDLYVRADVDRDGRIEMDEMHNLLSTYLSDLVSDNVELPRGFSLAVTRAVISTKDNNFVGLMEPSLSSPAVQFLTVHALCDRVDKNMHALRSLLKKLVEDHMFKVKLAIGFRLV